MVHNLSFLYISSWREMHLSIMHFTALKKICFIPLSILLMIAKIITTFSAIGPIAGPKTDTAKLFLNKYINNKGSPK